MSGRDMPRLVRLLGFDDEDWESWLSLKDQMGDAPDLIESVQANLAEANKRFEVAAFQIEVVSEILYRQNPEAYAEAVKTVTARMADKSG